MSIVIQVGKGVTVLWGVENDPSPLLWPVAYTTAFTGRDERIVVVYFTSEE